jgi:hypothetical protein
VALENAQSFGCCRNESDDFFDRGRAKEWRVVYALPRTPDIGAIHLSS